MKTLIENILARFGYFKSNLTNVPFEKDLPEFPAKPKRKPAVKKATTRKVAVKK